MQQWLVVLTVEVGKKIPLSNIISHSVLVTHFAPSPNWIPLKKTCINTFEVWKNIYLF